MNNFKPSRLPVDTIIAKIDTEERFIKRAPGLWDLLDVHCGDCGEVVIESETEEDLAIARMHAYKAFGAADKYFGDNYKIIAVPFALLEIVAKHANDGYEDDAMWSIIRCGIEDLNEIAKRDAEIAEDAEKANRPTAEEFVSAFEAFKEIK